MAAAVALLAAGCASGGLGLGAPECEAEGALRAVAQSVPSAGLLPCVAEDLPAGWTFGGIDVERGRTEFWLDFDRIGGKAVVVTLAERCDVAGATRERASATSAAAGYLRLTRLTPSVEGTRYDLFSGGCVTYDFDVPEELDLDVFLNDIAASVGLFERRAVADEVRSDLGLELDP